MGTVRLCPERHPILYVDTYRSHVCRFRTYPSSPHIFYIVRSITTSPGSDCSSSSFSFWFHNFFPHPSRYLSFVLRTRVLFSRDAQSRGGRGQHPSCRKSRVYYYDHMFMPRLYLGKGEGSMGGVHLLESYDTRLRGCTRGQSKQPTVGYVSLCKQKATYVVDPLE